MQYSPRTEQRRRSRPRPALGGADGFTFPELIVATVVTLIIGVAIMALIGVSFRQNQNQYDRVVAIDEARTGLLKMTTEIRSAVALESVSSQVLDVLVEVPEDLDEPYHWIRYKCVGNTVGSGSNGLGGTCSRQDKTIHSGSDCDDAATGPGCTVILRNVTKQDTDSFDEPCDNYDPATNEEKHFCVKQNRTVQLSVFALVQGAQNPIELRSAVTIRNCLTNQGEVIPCPTTA